MKFNPDARIVGKNQKELETAMSTSIKQEHFLELKKHVNAVHCSNNLTLVQRKLFDALLHHAYHALLTQQTFKISTKELTFLIGYKSNDYQKLKHALLGLVTTAIEWNVIDCQTGKETQWSASCVLASAELSNGFCTYEYSQVMRKLLYQPEIYARLNLSLIAQFKSKYGLALYENCIRYQGLPQTAWFPLPIFRKLMGVADTQYETFNELKKRVLNIAVAEVNTLSPITVEQEVERKNKQVIMIRFKIGKNIPTLPETITSVEQDVSLLSILSKQFELSPSVIADIFLKYDEEYIKGKAQIVMSSESFLAGKIKGLAAYLIDALKKDYKANKTSRSVINAIQQQESLAKKAEKEKEEDRRNRHDEYVYQQINHYLSGLTELEHQQLAADFDRHVKTQNKFIQDWYKESKLSHPGVRAIFTSFIQKTREKEVGEMLAYEDFV